jgi:hypothetical protein
MLRLLKISLAAMSVSSIDLQKTNRLRAQEHPLEEAIEEMLAASN